MTRSALTVVVSASLVVGSLAAVSPTAAAAPGSRTSTAQVEAEPRGDLPADRGIAAAWVYLSDNQDYRRIPPEWKSIDFRRVDLLAIGPAGVQDDGRFGLYESEQTGRLLKRLKWVMRQARTQNPHIRIVVSQWWGDKGATSWGHPLTAVKGAKQIDRYARSVADFMRRHQNYYGGLNGYDIDYEDDNVLPRTRKVIAKVRAQLDRLGQDTGRHYLTTVSPAKRRYLRASVEHLDYVFMQTYAGGYGLRTSDFRKLGFRPSQLFYGICPETDCETDTVAEVEESYTRGKLAGIHLWRLNSGNYRHEGKVQKQVFDFLRQRG